MSDLAVDDLEAEALLHGTDGRLGTCCVQEPNVVFGVFSKWIRDVSGLTATGRMPWHVQHGMLRLSGGASPPVPWHLFALVPGPENAFDRR